MALRGFGKKKNVDEELIPHDCGKICKPSKITAKKTPEAEKTFSDCCDGENSNEETMAQAETAKTSGIEIKVLGSGCAKCNQLEATIKEALADLDMDITIDHVTEFTQIAAYGVMTTPALVVDGKVISSGKILKKDEVVKLLEKIRR